MKRVDDQTLVERTVEGDVPSFEELVSRYENKVYRLAIKLTRNETLAEEVMQEVFLRVYEKLHTFRGESAFSSWLYRIAANVCFAKLKSERKHEHSDLDDELAQVESGGTVGDPWMETPDRAVLSDEAMRLINAAIERLPEDFRVVLILRDVENLSNEEVARILDLSVPAVKSRLHRARLAMRKRLAGYFGRKAPAS
jgi:RNA polymerase sigma-70 factor (ECF subfamily)